MWEIIRPSGAEVNASQNTLPPLPKDFIETARTLADAPEHYQFQLGDLINNKVAQYESLTDRRRARWHVIHELNNNAVADESTLRDRSVMAAFWSPDMREEYDMLSYSQKRAIKAAGVLWKEYAEWTLQHLPAPVWLIRKRIKDKGDGEERRPGWERMLDKFIDIAYALERDESAPCWVRQAARHVVEIAHQEVR